MKRRKEAMGETDLWMMTQKSRKWNKESEVYFRSRYKNMLRTVPRLNMHGRFETPKSLESLVSGAKKKKVYQRMSKTRISYKMDGT
jgi:hypothetical protein